MSKKLKRQSQPVEEEKTKIKFDKDDPVDCFLYALRRAFPSLICSIYLNGSCFELYRLLKLVWPEAVCYYSHLEGHVYTQIGRKFYDIRGAYSQLNRDAYIALPEIIDNAKTWANQNTVGFFIDRMFKDFDLGEDDQHDPGEFQKELVS